MPDVGRERKVVTVMFGDLVGSTELATRRDPEQLRALLVAFFDEMARQIAAFGGTVEKYAGDAIMAVFGVPRVHEDDAERAVRAAFAMQESLAQLNPMFEAEYDVRLTLRIGVATGEAVAATEATDQMMVTGEVANLAARLQSLATGVVVSEETRRQLGPLLDTEALPPASLKGFDRPVIGYLVRGLRANESRRGIPGLSAPLVGREPELATVRSTLHDLERGRGQIVSIVGEAGLGKTRLKNELRDGLSDAARWFEGRCEAYTQSASYEPILQIMRAVFRLGRADTSATNRMKLRATLGTLAVGDLEQHLAVLGHLLGGDTDSTDAMDPRARQSRLVETIRTVVEALLRRGPVVMALEDIHWADAASLELLTAIAELTDFQPLMILVTARPDAEGHAWEFLFHVRRNYAHRFVEVALQPLALDESGRLAEHLLDAGTLPENLRSGILSRAEGNPFFLEEIVRDLMETHLRRREDGRWRAMANVDPFVLPATVRGVLTARIDRLPAAAKTTLQRAAVIGRFFTSRALRALGRPDEDVDRSLALLLRAALVRESSRLPEPEYVFKHALTHEAAYASVVGEERRFLHGQLARWLEADGRVGSDHAALLAHHWTEAEELESALRYSLEAAERARKLYAQSEAIVHYWHAIDLIDRLPPATDRSEAYTRAILVLCDIPGWVKDDTARAAGLRHLRHAMTLADSRGDAATLARLEARLGRLTLDDSLLARAVARAEASGDRLSYAFALELYGSLDGQRGRYDTGVAKVGRSIEILGEEGQHHDQAWTMVTSGRCWSARAGELDRSLRYAAAAREIDESVNDLRLRAWRGMEAEPYMYLGRWTDVVRVAENNLSLAWDLGEWDAVFWVSAWLGIAHVKLGRPDEARRVVERALAEADARAIMQWQITFLYIALAQIELAVGNSGAALDAARKAVALAEATRASLELGAALRVLGEACVAVGQREQAASAFRRSLDVLEEIQSRPELAQTLLTYGRFLVDDDPATADALVARARSIFEEIGAEPWAEEVRAAAR